MKTTLATILLLTCGWSPVVAQTQMDAATKDDVHQFVSLMNMRQQMSLVMNAMMQQLTNGMIGQYKSTHPNATSAEIAKFERCISSGTQIVVKNFPIDEAIDAIAPIYQRHFTHSDMQGLIEFYSSPTGQKFIRESPAITNDAMQAGNAVMQKHLPEIRAQIERATQDATITTGAETVDK